MPDRAAQPEAPATEVEVTDEMIAAGAQAFSLYETSEDDWADMLSAVYRAMSAVKEFQAS